MNHYGIQVDKDIAITGVVSNNEIVQFLGDAIPNDAIDVAWEDAVEEYKSEHDGAEPDNDVTDGWGESMGPYLLGSIAWTSAPSRLPKIPKLNGQMVIYRGDAVFLPLPPALWTESGFATTDDGKRCCSCGRCSGFGFWDTLMMARNPKGNHTGHACTVHAPEYHGDVERYRKMAETLLRERGER